MVFAFLTGGSPTNIFPEPNARLDRRPHGIIIIHHITLGEPPHALQVLLLRPKLLLNHLIVSLPKQLITIIKNPILEGELLDLPPLPLLLNHGLHQINDPVMAGPQIGLDLGEDQNAVEVHLEGAGLGELDELVGLLVVVLVVVVELRVEFPVVGGDLVLQDDDVGDVGLELLLH